MKPEILVVGLLLFGAVTPSTALGEPWPEAPVESDLIGTESIMAQSSTTTISLDLDRWFQVSAHPTSALGLLSLELTWTAAIEEIHCNLIVDPASYTVEHEHDSSFKSIITINFGPSGLRQSQRIMSCKAFVLKTEDAGGQPHIKVLEAKGTDGAALDGAQAVCVDCRAMFEEPHLDPDWADPPNGYDNCGANFCGDAAETISYTTLDALWVLQGAAGTRECPLVRCDVDRSGTTAAADALQVLRRAVGLPGVLLCEPPPGADCFLSTTGDD